GIRKGNSAGNVSANEVVRDLIEDGSNARGARDTQGNPCPHVPRDEVLRAWPSSADQVVRPKDCDAVPAVSKSDPVRARQVGPDVATLNNIPRRIGTIAQENPVDPKTINCQAAHRHAADKRHWAAAGQAVAIQLHPRSAGAIHAPWV